MLRAEISFLNSFLSSSASILGQQSVLHVRNRKKDFGEGENKGGRDQGGWGQGLRFEAKTHGYDGALFISSLFSFSLKLKNESNLSIIAGSLPGKQSVSH